MTNENKIEQINVLLSGDPYEYACKQLNVKDMSSNQYSEVFTVSLNDVIQYVLENGFPPNDSNNRSSDEGFHYYEDDGVWHTYFTERGMTFDERIIDDYDDGIAYIVEMLLRMKGTGLY